MASSVLLSTYEKLSPELKTKFQEVLPDSQRVYVIRDRYGKAKSMTTSIFTSIKSIQK